MWQITLFELDKDKIAPKRSYYNPSGTVHYTCGICGEPVGIHSGKCAHVESGWLYQRECCVNGHAVDWEAVK